MARAGQKTSGTGSSRKVLRLLMSFDESRPSATAEQLAKAADVPLSTAYRYISLLREVGLLEEGPSNSYVVSVRALPLARAALAANPLAEKAMPILRAITETCGETSLLLRRVAQSAVCVARSESPHPVRLSFDVGRAMPLHRGAAAKILLSALNPQELDHYFRSLPAGDDTARAELEQELATIRTRGWSVSHGEVDQGIWAAAAPVADGKDVVGALTVAGLAQNIDDKRRHEILDSVKTAAQQLSEQASRMRL